VPELSLELLVGAALAGAVGLCFVAAVRRWPQAGVLTALLVIAFVPIWVGVQVVVFLPLAGAVAGAVAIALLTRQVPLWSFSDLLLLFLFVSALAPLAIGRLSLASAFGVVSVWVAGYLFGRLAYGQARREWVYGCVAVVFAVVAALAVVEFATGWHGLSSWGPSNSAKAAWGTIQGRGGLERSEGAFGHSIALGSSLAIAAALTVEARFRTWMRLALIALLAVGAAVSLSRTGLVCTALGLVLGAAFLRSPQARAVRKGLVALLVVGALTLTPFVLGVIAEAGDEATRSADYRGSLLSLLPYIDLLGNSPAMQRSATGALYFGGFQSIDSQLILFGLSYGWLTLLWVLVLLTMAALTVLVGRGNAAMVAVVAQVPALVTVALITQYALLVWFTVGLAVAAHTERRGTGISSDYQDSRPAAGRPAGKEVTA
jgi:hypothetical protein